MKLAKFSLLAWKHLFMKPYICITICDCALAMTCSWSWCEVEFILGLHYIKQTWMPWLFNTWFTVSGCEKFLAHKKERLCSLCRQATMLCVCVCSAGSPGTVSSFSHTWLCNSPPSARILDPQEQTWQLHFFQQSCSAGNKLFGFQVVSAAPEGTCGSLSIMPLPLPIRTSSNTASCMEYMLFLSVLYYWRFLRKGLSIFLLHVNIQA